MPMVLLQSMAVLPVWFDHMAEMPDLPSGGTLALALALRSTPSAERRPSTSLPTFPSHLCSVLVFAFPCHTAFMAPAMPSSSKMAQSKVANVAMSAVVDEVMDKLKAMTLLEASELVKAIEETFDVDASAGGGGGMMMMAPGAAGGADAGGAAAEEKTEFDLVLDSFPADKKIAVLKVTPA